ncbi:hypothetical protein ABPG72_014575 [Tetrahymena utriculariae]
MNKCEECIQYDTKCTKCKGNSYLVNHSCEDSCPDKGYYFDKNNKCLPCHEDCEKCSGSPTNCIDCEYPMYLENNKCFQECLEGKYGAYVQIISMCLQCDKQKCETCIDNKSKCTSSHEGQFVFQKLMFERLPQRNYQKLVTQSCLVCLQPNFAVCEDNVGVCIQCREGYIQHQGICTKECPFGYFLNKSENKCKERDKKLCMESSSSPKNCTLCYPEHYGVGNGVCSTSFPKISYPFQQEDQQVCLPCDPLCTKDCVHPLDSECLEAVYITQEANNQAILIGLLSKPIKSYLLKRESQQSYIVTACSQFLNKIDATLIIPLGQTCQLEDISIDSITLNSIKIEGTLFIKDDLSMIIKYKELSLDQKRSLEIGKDTTMINNLIVFEDISTQQCQEPTNTQSIGKINIQSRFIETQNLNDIYKAQIQIQFQYITSEYSCQIKLHISQQLLLLRNRISIIHLRCKEQNLILRDPIKSDNLAVEIQRELVIKPMFFSDVHILSGVIFKNSCITGYIEKFQGVTLLNPRGLFLKGEQIQSSLIKIENQDQQITRTIKTEGGFQKNIFYKCQQLNVQVESEDQNSFVGYTICSGSSTNCIDCEYPMFLEGSKCIQECPPGKYGAYVQSINKCLDCDTNKWQNCVDNKSKCTSCNGGYFLYKNQCTSDCPKGTNKNLVTQSCLVCLQLNFAVCGDNIGVCVQCHEGFIQYQGVCTKECPVGYFSNKSENKCQECDKRVCMECSESPTNCTKCYPEHFNVGNGACSTACPKMAYPLQLGKACFSFCVITQACSQFLNMADASLIIPLGETCQMEDISIDNITLNTITIEGTLSIKDNVSMTIKYKDLSLGQKGSLEIGKDAAIINNLIVFEDVSSQQCQQPANTQSTGKINIQSRFMQTYNLNDIYKAQTQIQFQGKPVDILTKQNYILVNSFSLTEQQLNIQDIQEETLTLREPIQEDNLTLEIQRELVIRPIFFSDMPVISGVILKNSCLIGNIEKFQGVTLLNPRGLFLKGGQIQSSLIKIKNQDQQITRTIKTEGGFQKNIFYKCQQLNVQIENQNQNSFVDNIVVSSDNLQITVKSNQFNKNSFINSKIAINSQDINYLSFSQLRSFNTSITVLNQENSVLLIRDKSIIYRNKVFQVFKSLDKFLQDDTIFFATTLDLSKAIVNTKFSISNSFFDGNDEVDHLAIFSNHSKLQYIQFEYTLAVKFNSFLLTSSDKLKQLQTKYFSRISSETLFHLYIKFFKINNKIKDYLPLFNLPMMNLVTKSSQVEYNIIEVDDQNTNTQSIMLSKFKWAPVQVYQTNSLPTYYQIKNIVTTDNNSNIKAKISFDGLVKQDLNLNQYSQLIGDQIKQIEFFDDNGKKSDPLEFTIQLNAQSRSQTGRYQSGLIFPSTQKAIKKVTVVQINDSKEEQAKVETKIDDSYQYSYSTILFWNQSLNQFSLVWKKMESGFTTYKIKFEYCEENELFNGVSCVTQCNTSKMEFFCSKDCGEGYYKDSINPNICLKCSFGCKQCKDNSICLKCYDFYFSDGKKCIDNCGINQVAYKNQCQKCGNSCGFCYSSEECTVCQGLFSLGYNGQCKMCKENQDEYCDNCPKNCKSCVDNNNYYCFECEDGYELVFGQCKKKNIQVAQQSCENGQIFINGSCQQCFQGFLSCSKPNNQYECYSCITSYSKDYFGSSCKKCKEGEYSASRDTCQSCNQLCDNKLSCVGPSVFQCQKCQAGYFKHLQTNKCMACNSSKCKECSESPTQCTGCPERQFLYDKQCLSKCPSGWYPDEKRVCWQCNQQLCKECSNSHTQCTECKKDQVLFEEKCYKDCKPGFFADKQSVCKSCDLNKCEECIQYDTKCTKCKEGLYLINHSCEEQCPDKGYYFDQNKKCLPCHEDCEKCSGSSTNCTDCEYPMFLEGSKCIQECPPGKYGAYVQSISKCLDCDTNKCQNCVDNKSKCTSCNKGYFFYKNECMSDCPKGTNKNLVTQSCLVCLQPNCAVCGDNIGVCVQCHEGFIQYQGVCTKECPVGYFSNKSENKCQECDKRVCMECSESPTNCTKCYPEHFNVGNGACSTTCPKMAYPLQLGDQQICKPCNPTCTKGCVGPLDSECLEAVYITQEANNQAILIGLMVVCFVLLIGLIFVGYLYYKRKQALPYKSYLLKRESQSDIGTVIQMEKTESLKKV